MSCKLNEFLINRDTRNSPGPASYDVLEHANNMLKKMPAYKIGSGKREYSNIKEWYNFPHPQSYDLGDSFKKKT